MFETPLRTYVTRTLIGLSILVLACYAAFEFRHVIEGPIVTIDNPASGSIVESPVVELQGKARNIAYISLNNKPIFVDAAGLLYERLLLLPGYNRLTIEAKDRFGRTTQTEIVLIRQ